MGIRRRARRSRPSSPRRPIMSRSPVSRRNETIKRVLVEHRSSPAFETMATPAQAIDRLAELYGEATSALRNAVERFLKDGTAPPHEIRAKFRYPQLRVTYKPEGVPP